MTGPDASSTSAPRGSSTGSVPRFATTTTSWLRSATTCGESDQASSQARAPWPRLSALRSASAARYVSKVEPGTPYCTSAA